MNLRKLSPGEKIDPSKRYMTRGGKVTEHFTDLSQASDVYCFAVVFLNGGVAALTKCGKYLNDERDSPSDLTHEIPPDVPLSPENECFECGSEIKQEKCAYCSGRAPAKRDWSEVVKKLEQCADSYICDYIDGKYPNDSFRKNALRLLDQSELDAHPCTPKPVDDQKVENMNNKDKDYSDSVEKIWRLADIIDANVRFKEKFKEEVAKVLQEADNPASQPVKMKMW